MARDEGEYCLLPERVARGKYFKKKYNTSTGEFRCGILQNNTNRNIWLGRDIPAQEAVVAIPRAVVFSAGGDIVHLPRQAPSDGTANDAMQPVETG